MAVKGRHEKQKEEKTEKTKKRRERKRAGFGVIMLRLAVVVLFAFVMLSPLRGCALSDDGLISPQDALNTVVRDAGVSPSLVTDIRTDTTSLDGRLCYLVDFSASGMRYRYVIDAASAEIIASHP